MNAKMLRRGSRALTPQQLPPPTEEPTGRIKLHLEHLPIEVLHHILFHLPIDAQTLWNAGLASMQLLGRWVFGDSDFAWRHVTHKRLSCDTLESLIRADPRKALRIPICYFASCFALVVRDRGDFCQREGRRRPRLSINTEPSSLENTFLNIELNTKVDCTVKMLETAVSLCTRNDCSTVAKDAMLVIAATLCNLPLTKKLLSVSNPATFSEDLLEQWPYNQCATSEWGDLLEKIVRDVRVDPSKSSNETFLTAVSYGLVNVVAALMDDDRVDVTHDHNCAIIMAASNGDEMMVQLLLSDARVDPSDMGNEAVSTAAENLQFSIVKLLLNSDERVHLSFEGLYFPSDTFSPTWNGRSGGMLEDIENPDLFSHECSRLNMKSVLYLLQHDRVSFVPGQLEKGLQLVCREAKLRKPFALHLAKLIVRDRRFRELIGKLDNLDTKENEDRLRRYLVLDMPEWDDLWNAIKQAARVDDVSFRCSTSPTFVQ